MLSQPEDINDRFRENFNIVVQDLSSQPINLDEYIKLSLEQINQYITDVEIITSKKVMLANGEGYMLNYTGKQGQFNLEWLQFLTIKNNIAYVLSYTAEESNYDKYLEIINQMINSFRLKK